MARSQIILMQLHKVLQIAMGWADSHLHQFTVYGQSFGRHHSESELEILDGYFTASIAPPSEMWRQANPPKVVGVPRMVLLFQL
jgi:hypothetical protein